MMINEKETSKNLVQAILNKYPRPKHEINFARTLFYKNWRKTYGYLQKFDIPVRLVDKLQKDHIYPIKLTKDSPIYFFKIHSIHLIGEINYVKCLVYLRYKDLPTCEVEKADCPAQLLLCDKFVKIPAKLLIFYLLTTKYQSWEKALCINDKMDIMNCSIEIVCIDHLSLIYSYKKRLQMNMPFRRLPNNLSIPDLKYLSLTNLTANMKIDDFVDTDAKYLGFSNDSFKLGHSLLRVRIDFKNYDGTFVNISERAKMQRYIRDCQQSVGIIDSPTITKKSSRRRGRLQDRQQLSQSIVVDEAYASSISQTPSDILSVRSAQEGIPQDDLNTDSTSLSPSRSARPVSIFKGTRRRKRYRRARHKHRRILTRKRNDERTEPIKEAQIEPEIPNLPRRSARNAQKALENNETKENIPNDNNDFPDHKSETYSVDFNFQGDSMGLKSTIKKLLRHYNKPKIFYHDYQIFYNNLNNHLPRIPKMGWLEVDVFKLFRQTIQRGGFHEVTRRLMWKDVYKSLNNTTIVSNAATTVKTHYRRLLYDFEEYLFSCKDKHFSFHLSDENNMLSPVETDQNVQLMDSRLETTQRPVHQNDFLMDNILKRREPEESPRMGKYVASIVHRQNALTESSINRPMPMIPDPISHYPPHRVDPMHRGCACEYNFNPHYNCREFAHRSPHPLPFPPIHFDDMAARMTQHHSPMPMDLEHMNHFPSRPPSPGRMLSPFFHHINNLSPRYMYSRMSPPPHYNTNGARHRPLRPPCYEHYPSPPYDYHYPYTNGMRPPAPYLYPTPYFENQNGHYHRRR